MPRPDDLSRSLVTLQQDSTLIAVVELSQSSWLVAGIVPGLARHPLKKLEPDQEALLRLLRRWREEATKAGRTATRIAVAFEAGRDGFWLARWLRARGVETHVIHGIAKLLGQWSRWIEWRDGLRVHAAIRTHVSSRQTRKASARAPRYRAAVIRCRRGRKWP
jgi:hypothetical protein